MEPFSRFATDRVTLIKKDGRRFENIPAIVRWDTISTEAPAIPIAGGDLFERKLPSDGVEAFTVVGTGFTRGSFHMPDHHQSRVRHRPSAATKTTR
jgi:hypothetical protein